ncbi:MAG: GspE/PulE family protein [Burkholderiaceae bacterium]|jgi:type II secretory ATPase GspE/PulE/Tfp pilus assembly ATPase PilB-like protein
MNWSPRVFDDIGTLIQTAAAVDASDIHFAAQRARYRIRCRIHGSMCDLATLDTETARACIQRIKAQAGMNIAESRLPQDGRLSLQNGDVRDVRVATHPTLYGENVVMRLLRQMSGLALAGLGFGPETLRRIAATQKQQAGITLVAGPTGAGKTTTLHALLRELDVATGNIMTLEDPVELEWEAASQTDLSGNIKMDFASGLRSLLRQDPDVILIGEIRDSATAGLAVQAAMTGHQVFASVHASDALGTVARLMDLGIEPRRLLPHLNAVIAQRLLQTPTTKGGPDKKPRHPVAEVWFTGGSPTAERYSLETLGQIAADLTPRTFWSMAQSIEERQPASAQAGRSTGSGASIVRLNTAAI